MRFRPRRRDPLRFGALGNDPLRRLLGGVRGDGDAGGGRVGGGGGRFGAPRGRDGHGLRLARRGRLVRGAVGGTRGRCAALRACVRCRALGVAGRCGGTGVVRGRCAALRACVRCRALGVAGRCGGIGCARRRIGGRGGVFVLRIRHAIPLAERTAVLPGSLTTVVPRWAQWWP
ncbi:hypothetical protein YT1_4364 [Rhodococcus ruber]|nr:hypothetical protein YT1_4364 [Rhodococcus ruber]